MTRMAPGFPVLATLTSAEYAAPDLRFRPPDGVRPSSVWHDVHAGVRLGGGLGGAREAPVAGGGAGDAGLLEPHPSVNTTAERATIPTAALTMRNLTAVPQIPDRSKVARCFALAQTLDSTSGGEDNSPATRAQDLLAKPARCPDEPVG